MPVLHSRLGDWDVDHVHNWSDRLAVIRATPTVIVRPETRVATIGSCFAAELARMMGSVGINGAMHPGGLFYSTATIRQELERIAGGWPERADEPIWVTDAGLVDPFRDYGTAYEDEAALRAGRATADSAAERLFHGAAVVVVTLGLIETWRSRSTGNTFRQIPHPGVFQELAPEFHRLTVSEMLADLERIHAAVRGQLGAELVVTTSPVPLHATFTDLDVRVANVESKSRIRAAVSEFVERHQDVHYFHSYEMVVTSERQSDYFRDDGRHIHQHGVRYIVSEFLRLYADPTLHLSDVDSSWLTPITKTQPSPTKEPIKPKRPPRPLWRRAASGARRRISAALGPRPRRP